MPKKYKNEVFFRSKTPIREADTEWINCEYGQLFKIKPDPKKLMILSDHF
jgi:hypothetical protein